MHPVLLYLATAAIFFAIDMFWLGVVAVAFYRTHLGYLLAPEVGWTAAIIFYLIFIAGLLLFAVYPAIDAGSLLRAALLGAAFGFVCYATYDLTNQATVRDWPLIVTLVDLAWGTVLGGVVASLSFLVHRLFS